MVWSSSAGGQCQLTSDTTVTNTDALTCARVNSEDTDDDTSEQLAFGQTISCLNSLAFTPPPPSPTAAPWVSVNTGIYSFSESCELDATNRKRVANMGNVTGVRDPRGSQAIITSRS